MILTAGFCFCLIVGNVKLFGKEFIGVSGATAMETEHGQKSSRQVILRGPALPVYNPFMLHERNKLNTDDFSIAATGPCFTNNGGLGKCVSFRQCYPYFKQQDTFDNWILGMYDTCSYYTSQGRQMFGICCMGFDQSQQPDSSSNAPSNNLPAGAEVQNNTVAKPYIPQILSWPPPLPTHPPHHTIPPLPTHPPSPGYPTYAPPTAWPPTQKPITQKPITQKPITQKPVYRPPTQNPIYKPTTPKPILTSPKPVAPVYGSCGAKNGYQDQGKIVGGQEAEPNEWPWIAGLFNGGRQFCGGSLIDNMHILSAAHCVAHMSSWDVARLTVRLGDHNIHSNTDVRHIEKRVKRVIRHGKFNSQTLYNDIAILRLDSPVEFSKQVRPVCLPRSGASYAGKTATVIGWGSLSENGYQPAALQKVNIPIWTNDNCRLKYGPAAPGGIVDHMLCAGQAAKDSCSGDSGGPLMVKEDKWTQVGIVSWGIGCGKGQYPGVYTRVEKFLPWIEKNLRSH